MTSTALPAIPVAARSEPSPTTLRAYVGATLVAFLTLWMVSAEQYLFCPAVATAALLIGPLRQSIYRFTLLEAASGVVVVLAAGAVLWSEYRGNAIRTADVWASAAILSIAYRCASDSGRRYLVKSLLGVWILCVLAYVFSQAMPAVTDALEAARRPVTNTVAVGFWTPSLIFDFEVNRPIGFLLYANELALFGLLIVAVRLKEYPASKLLAAAYISGSTYFLLLSTSRTLIGLFLLSCTAFAISRMLPRRLPRRVRGLYVVTAVASVALTAVVVTPILVPDLGAQQQELAEARYGASDELRELSYSTGLRLARENPLSGVGGLPQLGNIQAGSHSLPLSLWVRHGLPGLLLILTVLGVVGAAAVRALLAPSTADSWIGAMLFVALGSCLTIQFDDDIFSLVGVILATVAARDS